MCGAVGMVDIALGGRARQEFAYETSISNDAISGNAAGGHVDKGENAGVVCFLIFTR